MTSLTSELRESQLADLGQIPTVPPITFIFGSPRSGTTLLAKLLDSSPSVLYLHEPISKGRGLKLHHIIHCLHQNIPIPDGQRQQTSQELTRSYSKFLQPPFFRKNFNYLPGETLAWTWNKVTGRPAPCFAGPHRMDRVGMTVIKDGLTWFSRPLTREFAAQAIILLRHPCAVVNSMLRGQKIGAMGHVPRASFWKSEQELLRQLGYREEDVLALLDDEFEALRWLAIYLPVTEWAADARFKVVTYGHVVRDTDNLIDDIFPWLGLNLTNQTREFVKQSKRTGGTWLRKLLGAKKSYYAIAPRTENPESVWRTELSQDSITRILKIVARFPIGRYWANPST